MIIPFMTTHEPMRLRRQISSCTWLTASDLSSAKLEVKDAFLRIFYDDPLDQERWVEQYMKRVVSKITTYLHHSDLFQVTL